MTRRWRQARDRRDGAPGPWTRLLPRVRLIAPRLGEPLFTLLRFFRHVAIWYAVYSVVPGLAVLAAEIAR